MPVKLIESLATTEPLSDVFSDKSVLQAMLDFEIALARVESALGIIPESAARAIASVQADVFDIPKLSRESLLGATPGIPLSKALTELVRSKNAEAAKFVHWGATSQDVSDTALVLLLKRARPILADDLTRLGAALRRLAEEHQSTVMLGRTLLQAAPPVTFGLKAAGWLRSIDRGRERLEQCFSEAMLVQFGGASGTAAALGDKGIAVGRALAEELGLGYPDAPWHTHRDPLAALMCACGILAGSLGKMARDISLLMQGEVGEASEPGGAGRGGSSTMPHKRNPIGCTVTLAASHRVPGLVASYLAAMVQEHERAVGGWQSEWSTVASIIQNVGLASASMAEVAEGLTANAQRMRANIVATHGAIFAERAMMLLGPALGRDVAHKIMEEATRRSDAQGRHLSEILAEMPEVAQVLGDAVIRSLEAPEEYLGVADEFRRRLLKAAERENSED
jgi:3-carboxy-cis,cis-muconate cycloisomerase